MESDRRGVAYCVSLLAELIPHTQLVPFVLFLWMLDNWNDSFAKTQLEKYGWKKYASFILNTRVELTYIYLHRGDGLGKNKHGNTKHITVKVKNDTKGIGGNQQQWDFAWWDHLYNKSASSVTVEKDESKEVGIIHLYHKRHVKLTNCHIRSRWLSRKRVLNDDQRLVSSVHIDLLVQRLRLHHPWHPLQRSRIWWIASKVSTPAWHKRLLEHLFTVVSSRVQVSWLGM